MQFYDCNYRLQLWTRASSVPQMPAWPESYNGSWSRLPGGSSSFFRILFGRISRGRLSRLFKPVWPFRATQKGIRCAFTGDFSRNIRACKKVTSEKTNSSYSESIMRDLINTPLRNKHDLLPSAKAKRLIVKNKNIASECLKISICKIIKMKKKEIQRTYIPFFILFIF